MSSSYINGNYIVTFDRSGTRFRRALRVGENFNPIFPDSIDLKVSNICDIGCPFCHENSVPTGKTCSWENLEQVLSPIKDYPIEIAIGGGDLTMIVPQVLDFGSWCSMNTRFQLRITINSKSIIKRPGEKSEIVFNRHSTSHKDRYTRNVGSGSAALLSERHYFQAIGISISSFDDLHNLISNDGEEGSLLYRLGGEVNQVVWHIVIGVMPVSDFARILKEYTNNSDIYFGFSRLRFLILGFKQYGRASNVKEINELDEWRSIVKQTLWTARHVYSMERLKCIFAFDNLAIEQLGIKESLSVTEWSELYLGDEFSSSMYINAVDGYFGHNSRSKEGIRSWDEISILDYFKDHA
jgi:hypothetical protein